MNFYFVASRFICHHPAFLSYPPCVAAAIYTHTHTLDSTRVDPATVLLVFGLFRLCSAHARQVWLVKIICQEQLRAVTKKLI